ncbi:MAG: M20 family metallopeptidase [Deinococcales bacterium]
MNLRAEVSALTESLVAVRRDFHQHPEIAFEEVRTSAIIADHLEALGLEVERHVGKTGVVAKLRGAKPGKTVLIRADIDALPFSEQTGAAYASQTPGAMHACGHDGHASIAMHVARIFAKHQSELHGNFLFVFQPAEEIVSGAKAMLADRPNLLEGVDRVVGLHLWNDKPVGWVGARVGASFASADAFSIFIQGKGGHAAVPHQTVDPVVVGAQLILALQTVVSRNTDPQNSSVVSVCTIIAGEGAHNIIPDNIELRCTLRTFDPELRLVLQKRIEALCTHTAEAFGASARLEWKTGVPPLVNDAASTERFKELALGVVSSVETHNPTMGGDDVAEFLARVPGVYFLVGSGAGYPHHHPKFDIDDTASLPLATELLAKVALEFAGNAVD